MCHGDSSPAARYLRGPTCRGKEGGEGERIICVCVDEEFTCGGGKLIPVFVVGGM